MEISPAATPSKLQAPSTAVGEQDVHVVNPHVQFGAVPWSKLTHDEQEQVVHDRVTFRPSGPTTGSFTTPPASPTASRRVIAPALNPTPPSSLASSTGFSLNKTAGPIMRSSPYAAQIRAELAAQQQQGKVVNAHLSFGFHPAANQHAGGGTSESMNMGRLGMRAMHQDEDM